MTSKRCVPPRQLSSAEVYEQIKRATQPKKKLTTTPDAQCVTDSALNPAEDQIWVFGLRARLAL